MKKIKFFTAGLLAITLLLTPLTTVKALSNPDPEIQAKSALLINADNDAVIYSENPDERIYPASTTKIMTTLLAIEAIENGKAKLDDIVTASYTSPEGLSLDGSTQNIVPGEKMPLKDLLYCTLVASANEACNIIGEYIAGGDIHDFIDMMNAKAKDLGCSGTHFANAHGLHDSNHYTTASDLYKIAKEALKHKLFQEICNTVSIDIPATNKSPARHLSTTNYLISPNRTTYYYQYAKGIKTGTTDEAGCCLISSASKNGVNFIAVVMGAQEKLQPDGSYINASFTESKRLYEWGFNNFKKKDLVPSSSPVKDIPIKLGKSVNSIIVKPQSTISALVPSDAAETDFTQNIVIYSERDKKPLTAPVSAGQVVGEISVSYKGKVIGTSKLVSSISVEQSKIQFIFYSITKNPLLLILTIIVILILLVLCLFVITNRRRIRSSRYHARGYSGRGRRRR